MGHAEMLLAVAGVKEEEIKQKAQQLSTGDWSAFPPAERLAFQFAYRLSREPAKLSDKDLQVMIATFGQHRTMDLIWYGSWCNYMTRVADSFQLPLEKTNVFARPPEAKPAEGEKSSKDK